MTLENGKTLEVGKRYVAQDILRMIEVVDPHDSAKLGSVSF